MREIKFRAWFDAEGGGYYLKNFMTNFLLSVLMGDLYEIEQFTGLYDATKWKELTEEERTEWTRAGNFPSEWKGREIYEGDKLEYFDSWGGKQKIVVKHTISKEIENEGWNEGTKEIYISGFFISGYDFDIKKCKVIGNIHDK